MERTPAMSAMTADFACGGRGRGFVLGAPAEVQLTGAVHGVWLARPREQSPF